MMKGRASRMADATQTYAPMALRRPCVVPIEDIQSFQKILASGIHRPSAEPRPASHALSYVLRRGSVDSQCSERQVSSGKTIGILVLITIQTSDVVDRLRTLTTNMRSIEPFCLLKKKQLITSFSKEICSINRTRRGSTTSRHEDKR
ncbi:hypothetical protein Y032_0390g550 [Ancylostoma ceylanicum]|uniref:Uncharacterized protein n=1 Tax=Ancylostoma ceylanicum TaxID=53326 RepID=A0A016RS04_9BILA|nr:hypothetical protein Y032_0390g550 [Ancylostoma ceylanicum]